MGEIAEMMLDGTLCEGCGDFIGSDAGFPQYCSPQCAAGRGMTYEQPKSRANARKAARINRERQEAAGPKPFACPTCSKRFRFDTALSQHRRDAHPHFAVL